MNSGTAVVLANLSQNYSTSSVPPKSQYLVFSPLKGHKKNHNFLDTPSAICDCGGGKEDTIHFITECALFATIRTNLMRSISNMLTHNNLEHKYIHDTKRFTRS